MNSYYRVLTDIKEKYDIDVVLGEDRREKEIAYREVNATRARTYVESFLHQELLVYSAETLRKSKLQQIVICENFAHCGGRANGAAEMKKLIVPGRKNTIYLDIATEHDNLHRATVHHEIFHAIDYSNGNWGYAGTEERASTDQFLNKKMKRLKLLLKNFSPQFSEDFWEKRRALSGPVSWLYKRLKRVLARFNPILPKTFLALSFEPVDVIVQLISSQVLRVQIFIVRRRAGN